MSGIVGPLFGIGKAVLGLYLSKKQANAIYVRLLPTLRYIIRKEGRSSALAKDLFEILEKLPSFGAKRLNFKKHYIDKRDGWKQLPDDPDSLPYGFWH